MKKVIKRVIGSLSLIALVGIVLTGVVGLFVDFYGDFGWHALWVMPLTLSLFAVFILLLIYSTTWLSD